MKLNLHIAWRFLLAKRRAMLMSLAGIVFGVAFFIVTQAQTSGFQNFFINTILGLNGAVRVQDRFQHTVTSMVAHGENTPAGFEVSLREGQAYVPGIVFPDQIMQGVLSFESVLAAAQVLRERVTISSGFKEETGRIHGIDLEDYLDVSSLGSQLVSGSIESFRQDPRGVMLGLKLAQRLQADIGDILLIRETGAARRFKVRAIYESGVESYDKEMLFVHMPEAQAVLDNYDSVSYIQVALTDPAKAPQVAEHMQYVLGHYVASWQERERSWLEVFRVLRISSGISMSVIILISGLGMFNTLAIIVMERAREIAILRSMGYTRGDISQIFLWQGVIVLISGTLLGWVAGALLTRGIESLPIRIRGIFATDHFIMEWSFTHYIWAAIVASGVVLVASYIPARRAARIEPGEVVRGTGG